MLTHAFFTELIVNPDECLSLALVCGFSVPSPVKSLRADSEHTTHSLSVSWEAPVGVYDGYSVRLLDEDEAMVANVSVPTGITRYRFEGLVPGRLYTVHLKTFSNTSHSKDIVTTGKTRKMPITRVDI